MPKHNVAEIGFTIVYNAILLIATLFFKKNSQKFAFSGFYIYFCHINCNFEYLFVFHTKASEKSYMTESLATKYCSETYK